VSGAADQGVIGLPHPARVPGKSLVLAADRSGTRLNGVASAATLRFAIFTRRNPNRSTRSEGCLHNHRGDEVSSSSISYLPATFTTLFLLAASLLLGLTR